jgi:hypothetical protein
MSSDDVVSNTELLLPCHGCQRRLPLACFYKVEQRRTVAAPHCKKCRAPRRIAYRETQLARQRICHDIWLTKARKQQRCAGPLLNGSATCPDGVTFVDLSDDRLTSVLNGCHGDHLLNKWACDKLGIVARRIGNIVAHGWIKAMRSESEVVVIRCIGCHKVRTAADYAIRADELFQQAIDGAKRAGAVDAGSTDLSITRIVKISKPRLVKGSESGPSVAEVPRLELASSSSGPLIPDL